MCLKEHKYLNLISTEKAGFLVTSYMRVRNIKKILHKP